MKPKRERKSSNASGRAIRVRRPWCSWRGMAHSPGARRRTRPCTTPSSSKSLPKLLPSRGPSIRARVVCQSTSCASISSANTGRAPTTGSSQVADTRFETTANREDGATMGRALQVLGLSGIFVMGFAPTQGFAQDRTDDDNANNTQADTHHNTEEPKEAEHPVPVIEPNAETKTPPVGAVAPAPAANLPAAKPKRGDLSG